MSRYVQNYVAIHGDERRVSEFKERYFTRVEIPYELNDKVVDYIYTFNVDALFPMPQELRETGAPTEVFDTQEEVDQANAAYAKSGMRGEVICIAITRDEALRRTFRYGRTARQRFYDDSEYGILNGPDWVEEHQASIWRSLPTEVISEEPGLLVFIAESARYPPGGIYSRLVDMGFKVSWAWQGDEDHDNGIWGDYIFQWKRRLLWAFQPNEPWPTPEELDRRAREHLKVVEREREERRHWQETRTRRTWAKWFREQPEDWGFFFPRHDMEAWIRKIEAEEGDI